MERRIPTKEEVLGYLHRDRNWGRWGPNDQIGTVNLITPQKRVQAAKLVRTGRTVSLSRDFPKTPAPNNPNPAQHWMRRARQAASGGHMAVDYYAIAYHGTISTHIDALCHTWDEEGMWNGRDPDKEITGDGARWGSVEHWRQGIITRGVLLDVPKHRREPYVTMEKPVHGWELEEIARQEGVKLEPGDALVVHCGREAYERDPKNLPYGAGPQRPGFHASCLKFIRETDVSLMVWDMLDMRPHGYDLPWTVHGAIFAYGLGLVDNCLLEPLAQACQEEGRYEFMLTVAPLPVVGGTGSPANPIALF